MDIFDFEQLKYSKDTSLRPYQKDNKEKIYEVWKDKRSVMFSQKRKENRVNENI